MQSFRKKVSYLLGVRGKCLQTMEDELGIHRSTLYRSIKTQPTIAAIAYYLNVKAEDLVAGTELEDVWVGWEWDEKK